MSRASAGPDFEDHLDALERATDELRESLHDMGREPSHDEARTTRRPTLELAISAAAAAMEANARALTLLAEAVRAMDGDAQDRGHRLEGPQARLGRALDELEAAVDEEVPAPARGLLVELRRLNAEIAEWVDAAAEKPGDHEVEIAVDAELESIRDELESTEG